MNKYFKSYLKNKSITKDINEVKRINSSTMKITEWNEICDLSFHKSTNRLEFIVKHYTKAPKITRYITRDYQKYAVYGGYSTRSKILKKFSKIINSINFVNKEILQLDYLNETLQLRLIDEIGIIPEWLKNKREIKAKQEEILKKQQEIRVYTNEKKLYSFKKVDLIEKPSIFWVRFVLAFITCGLSFLGFHSKKCANKNIKINNDNRNWNLSHKKEINLQNKKLETEIDLTNKELNKVMVKLETEINKIKKKDNNPKDFAFSKKATFDSFIRSLNSLSTR